MSAVAPGGATIVRGGAGGPPYVDLHAHSSASDGALRPAAVVRAAADAGLAAIALTDHDTLAGIPEAERAASERGIRLVSGVELSAHDGELEVHVLALHVQDLTTIGGRLERFREQRVARAASMVQRLAALGIPVTMEDVLSEAGAGAVGRPHVARAMLRRGAVTDFRDAFERYLAAGRPCYVEKPRLAVADAIAIAHSAGALAIWAHPGRDGTRERVARLAAAGLDGVEVRHPGHSFADIDRLRGFTTELDLVPSGGSDWHGATTGYRVLGSMHVPGAWLERHDARLAARAGVG